MIGETRAVFGSPVSEVVSTHLEHRHCLLSHGSQHYVAVSSQAAGADIKLLSCATAFEELTPPTMEMLPNPTAAPGARIQCGTSSARTRRTEEKDILHHHDVAISHWPWTRLRDKQTSHCIGVGCRLLYNPGVAFVLRASRVAVQWEKKSKVIVDRFTFCIPCLSRVKKQGRGQRVR